jgi:hypothetical protein
MNQFDQFLRQTGGVINRLGIHPLALTLGALFCLFFPRFFLLAAFGYGVYWVAKNIRLDSRRRGGGRGRRRR